MGFHSPHSNKKLDEKKYNLIFLSRYERSCIRVIFWQKDSFSQLMFVVWQILVFLGEMISLQETMHFKICLRLFFSA